MNVGGLLLLFLYIYAILGVYLFAAVKWTGPLNEFVNFKHIGTALLTLLRVSTGENWHEVMYALSNEKSLLYQCVEGATYQEYANAGSKRNYLLL